MRLKRRAADGVASVRQTAKRAAPQGQRGIAERVDALAAKTLPGLRRSVKWGMSYHGVGDGWCFCCGAFAKHVTLMFMNGVTLTPVPPLTPVAMGKSTRGVDETSRGRARCREEEAIGPRSGAKAGLVCGVEIQMTQVFIAQHPTEAHLVQGLLEANGIAAEVHGESLFSARGEAPATSDTLPSVWVLDDGQASSARAFLAEYGSREDLGASHGVAWACAACGGRIESQFTACWNCGAPRPQ